MKGPCYLCGEDVKLTSEHIIPQCLGGVLADRLYCVRCNSECGHDVDVELARHFGRYATLLQVMRDRGENQPFTIVTDESDLRLRCDGKSLVRAILRIIRSTNDPPSSSVDQRELAAPQPNRRGSRIEERRVENYPGSVTDTSLTPSTARMTGASTASIFFANRLASFAALRVPFAVTL